VERTCVVLRFQVGALRAQWAGAAAASRQCSKPASKDGRGCRVVSARVVSPHSGSHYRSFPALLLPETNFRPVVLVFNVCVRSSSVSVAQARSVTLSVLFRVPQCVAVGPAGAGSRPTANLT